MEALAPTQYSFADFELDAGRRVLLKRGKTVTLNSKTLDLLLALVERGGEIVGREELIEKVWPDQFVEEGNLSVHISVLRKALGEGKRDNNFIVTVPGRGYRFVAQISANDEIVLESHRLSRVLVEEEISEIEPSSQPQLNGTPRRSNLRWIALGSALVLVSLLGGGYLFQKYIMARAAPFQQMSIRRLTSIGNVGTATISPDGKLYAYAVAEGEQQSLWVGHVDGGDPLQIRPAAHLIYLGIKFTPDGSSIYYTTSENYAAGTLYRIPVFGGAPEKIRDNFRTLTFSPDGRQFAFVRDNEEQKISTLAAADAGGENEHEILALSKDNAYGWHSPAWSPDGLSMVMAATLGENETSVFAGNLADGSIRRLTSRAWSSIRTVAWLPDGNGLALVATEDNAINPQLWYISFPSGDARRLTTDLNFYGLIATSANGSILSAEGKNQSNIWVAPLSDLATAKQVTFGSPGQDDGWSGVTWTNDGRIVYTADTDNGTNIWLMDAEGKNRKQIIPNGGANTKPSVTEDSRFLIFQSNRGGHWAIWRSDLDGNNLTQITGNSRAGEPSVSPDGKWIVYENNYDGAGELWRMSIDGRDAVKLTDQIAEWPEVSPDSRFVACGLYFGKEVKLAILPIEGGEPVKLFDLPRLFNLRWGVRWMPDQKALTYRDWSNGIWKQSLDGGPPQRLEGLPEEKLAAYGWSPEGKQLAFSRLNVPRDVILIKDLSNN